MGALGIFNLMTTQESSQLLLVRVATEGPVYQSFAAQLASGKAPVNRVIPFEGRPSARFQKRYELS